LRGVSRTAPPTSTDAIVDAIDNAKSEVLVQVYSFTSKPIADALIRAQQRGVKVQVIMDAPSTHQKGNLSSFVSQAGIPVYLDSKHRIAHNKLGIIDGQKVIGGSFNWTYSAEKNNAENCTIIWNEPELLKLYITNWNLHKQHSMLLEE
jgi:phosphatidylserine/phosphatidylglycerophosphate/cardiolipin synthase-like enzyme